MRAPIISRQSFPDSQFSGFAEKRQALRWRCSLVRPPRTHGGWSRRGDGPAVIFWNSYAIFFSKATKRAASVPGISRIQASEHTTRLPAPRSNGEAGHDSCDLYCEFARSNRVRNDTSVQARRLEKSL